MQDDLSLSCDRKAIKILFYCSNNVEGGTVQNAANFIRNALQDENVDYRFVVSNSVAKVLRDWRLDSDRICIINKAFKSLKKTRQVLDFESDFNPDYVYTMAGPTYIRFKSYHVMGISDPYITHAKCKVFKKNRSLSQAISFFIKSVVKGFISRYSADHFIFQTESSRAGFVKRYLLSGDSTCVVPNAIGESFPSQRPLSVLGGGLPYRVVCPSAYYPHKNLEILFEVASKLSAEGCRKFKFFLTIPEERFFELQKNWPGSQKCVFNLGPYSYANVEDIYSSSDIVVLPSLLETFSTTYIEAISMGKPLIVSDESFARDICGTYPYYFDSLSVQGLCNALLNIDESFKSSKDREEERLRILSKYGTQRERYKKLVDVIISRPRS